MLARKSLSKKRIIILGGTMVLLWGIIGVVVYLNFVPKAPSIKPTLVLPIEPIISPGQPTGKFDLKTSADILRDPALTNLKIFGEVPLEVTTLGRDNPFSQINP